MNPDVETPFTDAVDAVNRLLPYHVFLQPMEDLVPLLHDRKGKTKAADLQEIEGDTSQAVRFAMTLPTLQKPNLPWNVFVVERNWRNDSEKLESRVVMYASMQFETFNLTYFSSIPGL